MTMLKVKLMLLSLPRTVIIVPNADSRKQNPEVPGIKNTHASFPQMLSRQHYEIDDCLQDNREDYYIRTIIMASSYNVRFRLFLCFVFHIRIFYKG